VVGRPRDPQGALLERARRGDTGAYEALVRAHQHVAFRTAFVFCPTAADAEDAAQEALLKAWRALPRFRPGAPFRPWLLAIVANEARSRARAAGRRVGREARALALEPPGAGTQASPEAAVLLRERRAVLEHALAALAERDRTVLTLRYVLGLSEAETAAALGCRRGTVKSRAARALERLRDAMEVRP
jgi:RNA polymerase sigma-70 factor (ECF subfamily)